MSIHLSYIASVVTRSYDSILNEINTNNGKYISNNAYNLGNHITSVVEETSVINGKELVIRRVFVHSADSGGYETVGWVLAGDVKYCMICSNSFGYFTYQHYCIACGNVVCQKCSSNEALIFEIEQLGPKRVCDQCYWGQVSILVAYFILYLCDYINLGDGVLFTSINYKYSCANSIKSSTYDNT